MSQESSQFQSSAVLKQAEKIPTRQNNLTMSRSLSLYQREYYHQNLFRSKRKQCISLSEKCFYSCNTRWCVLAPVLLHPLAFVTYQTSSTPSTKVRIVEVSPCSPLTIWLAEIHFCARSNSSLGIVGPSQMLRTL